MPMRNAMHKKTGRLTLLSVLALAMIALLVAAACGSSEDGPTLQPTSTPVPTASTQLAYRHTCPGLARRHGR